MKLLLIGSGELGSRFLQASINTNLLHEITVIEPNEESVILSKNRISELPGKTISIIWLKNISDLKDDNFNLCIIATQAENRIDIFKDIFKLKIRNILTEKIVTQSEDDFLFILNESKKLDVNIWVNCKTRCYPQWQYIKNKLNKNIFSYHSIGGNHGLCTNGIHTIDLFVFLSDSKHLINNHSKFDKDIYLTKRNKYDFSGEINIIDNNGSKCIIDYSSDNNSTILDTIVSKEYRWIIDHSTKQFYEGSFTNNWKLVKKEFSDDLSVSFMSINFITEILFTNSCSLPTLKETYLAHNFLFSNTLSIFNEYLKKTNNICPFT